MTVPTTPLREALSLAESEIQAGRPGEALRQCDLLLGTHPRWLEAQRLKARALVALNQLGPAAQLLDGIIACNPEDEQVYSDRAYLALRQGEPLGALAWYRRACEVARDNAALRATHNQLAAQLGRPPYTPSHTGLARLHLRGELFDYALREWDLALQANPNRLDAQIGLAETHWRMGNAARSRDICRYILRFMPNCLKPLLLLVIFELDAGNAEEAQRLTTLVAEMDPEQRVAGELFGDLVAVGHSALANLFRSAVRTQTTPLLRPNESLTGVFPALGARPATQPIPNGQLPTGPLFRPPTPPEFAPTSKLAMPRANGNGHAQGDIEDYFSRSRAPGMSDDFQIVFRETEYMLWSRDNEEPVTAEIPAVTEGMAPPPMSNGAGETVSTTPTVPADDTFVRWLQAQGARPLTTPVPPPAAPDAEPPTIGLPPFLAAALAESAPVQEAPESASIPSGEMPLAAEATTRESPGARSPRLGTETPPGYEEGAAKDQGRETENQGRDESRPYNDGAHALPVSAQGSSGDLPASPQWGAAARSGTWDTSDYPLSPESFARRDALDPSQMGDITPPAVPQVSVARTAAEPALDTPPDALDEALANASADDENDDLPPAPASMASQPPAAPMAATAPDAPEDDASVAATSGAIAVPAIAAEPEAIAPANAAAQSGISSPAASSTPGAMGVPEVPEGAPLTIEAIQQGLTSAGFARLDTGRLATVASSLDRAPEDAQAPTIDAAARLEMARGLRRQGKMGEALVEYRALVKASSERLPEIIRDLRDAAIEDPREGEIQRLLGDAYIRQGDYVEALEAYNRASTLRQEMGH
jgi:tetratricopeptide (TPR) repeat protein